MWALGKKMLISGTHLEIQIYPFLIFFSFGRIFCHYYIGYSRGDLQIYGQNVDVDVNSLLHVVKQVLKYHTLLVHLSLIIRLDNGSTI